MTNTATMMKLTTANGTPVTGLIPAAGLATRLGVLPYSKELLPIPAQETSPNKAGIRLAIEDSVRFLLECGVQRQHIVIAPAKQDIPAYLGDGDRLGASISYTVIADSPSVPHSLDAAYDSVAAGDVILVFPDIMFEPRAAIAEFICRRMLTDIDVLLALVPSARGDKVDMVLADAKGAVREIRPKPGHGVSGWTWVAAAWAPTFTEFMHEFLQGPAVVNEDPAGRELYMADILNSAIQEGLVVHASEFSDGDAIDIGTVDDYVEAWRRES